MSRAHRFATLVTLMAALPPLSLAQIPGLAKSSGAAKAETAVDPLGRSTPRGTIVEFTRAVDREDFATAAHYLQLDPAQPGHW